MVERRSRVTMLLSSIVASGLLSFLFAAKLTSTQLEKIREASLFRDISMIPAEISVGSHNLDVESPATGNSLLYDAIKHDEYGNFPKRILELGASPNFGLDKNGSSPLFTALKTNLSKIAPILVAKGADVNHVNDLGQTILMIACAKANNLGPDFWTPELLSNIGKLDNEGRSAFDYLNMRCMARPSRTEIAALLILGSSDVYFSQGILACIEAIGVKYGIDNMSAIKVVNFVNSASSFIKKCNEEKQAAVESILERIEAEGGSYDGIADVIENMVEYLDFKNRIHELLQQC